MRAFVMVALCVLLSGCFSPEELAAREAARQQRWEEAIVRECAGYGMLPGTEFFQDCRTGVLIREKRREEEFRQCRQMEEELERFEESRNKWQRELKEKQRRRLPVITPDMIKLPPLPKPRT